MLTKEEILSTKLSQAYEYSWDTYIVGQNEAKNAMDEYAKQVAIGFKKWCDDNEGGLGYGAGKQLTNEELFNFYSSPSIL